MDGFGGSDANHGKAILARECRAETQVQHSGHRGKGQRLCVSSGLNHVDARTLATIPKLGEVNGQEPIE
jgi:hypothetical protein